MLYYIDLFCGAGGTTTGVEQAHIDEIKCADVIACVNHDPHAIASHLANHPHAKHYTEDIRILDVTPLAELCKKVREDDPEGRIVLWASLECTNFSKAKGGMPRDADSRTLAEHLFRYIEAIHPDYIQIENVEEFMCWGDLDEHGRPVSKDKGKCYIKWINNVKRYGYDFDYRILNSADFGAYTSRKRYFGLFAMHGLPMAFPRQTYAKNGNEGGLFDTYHKWRPVRDVLDLQDEGESIFGRKKPLCEKTLERIHAGLIKFVAGGKQRYDSWLLKYNSTSQNGKHIPPSLDEPCPVITANRKHHYLMNPQFASAGGSIDKPCFTLIARMDKMPPYLVSTESGDVGIAIYETDSPMTKQIKLFLAAYGIVDIKMRMLKIGELKKIMGFPVNYKLVGSQAEQKKFIGNAVEVNMSRALCEALYDSIYSAV